MFGYVAAAYTTLTAYVISFVLHARYAKKLEKDVYPILTFLPSLLHIGVTVGVFYVFIDYWYLRWAVLLVYLIVMAFLNRKQLAELFPAVSSKFKRKV
jgi:O-antigen/teichoic acid export membrane protein